MNMFNQRTHISNNKIFGSIFGVCVSLITMRDEIAIRHHENVFTRFGLATQIKVSEDEKKNECLSNLNRIYFISRLLHFGCFGDSGGNYNLQRK